LYDLSNKEVTPALGVRRDVPSFLGKRAQVVGMLLPQDFVFEFLCENGVFLYGCVFGTVL